jgi:hypothetical protein
MDLPLGLIEKGEALTWMSYSRLTERVHMAQPRGSRPMIPAGRQRNWVSKDSLILVF